MCPKCLKHKDEEQFFMRNKETGKRHSQCKVCYQLHRQNYYVEHYEKYKEQYLLRAKTRREKLRQEYRENMLRYLANKECQHCGEKDIRVLELDHINPAKKLFTISQAVKLGFSWEEVLLEIEKCRILCANCHKKITAQQFSWYKT